MLKALDRFADRLFGRGDFAVTVPPMDGALRPNNDLEDAAVAVSALAPNNIVRWGDALLFSSGHDVLELRADEHSTSPRQSFHADIAAMAAHPEMGLATALETGEIFLSNGGAPRALKSLANNNLRCPTALAFRGPTTLIVCNGSATRAPSAWAADLMERNASGSVWELDIAADRARCLASGLAFPGGALVRADGIVVSEAWRHRLIRLSADGKAPEILLADLPGYPGRLTEDTRGGAYLCVFAPRSQLIEFVLREPAYRKRMMAEVPPEYWIAPAYSSGNSFLEPLQGGGVKQMGILKPWAPSRSHGLVVALDAHMQPVASHHSRADGRRHGVTSAALLGPRLFATSTGGDLIVSLGTTDNVGGDDAAAA